MKDTRNALKDGDELQRLLSALPSDIRENGVALASSGASLGYRAIVAGIVPSGFGETDLRDGFSLLATEGLDAWEQISGEAAQVFQANVRELMEDSS